MVQAHNCNTSQFSVPPTNLDTSHVVSVNLFAAFGDDDDGRTTEVNDPMFEEMQEELPRPPSNM